MVAASDFDLAADAADFKTCRGLMQEAMGMGAEGPGVDEIVMFAVAAAQ